MRRDEEITTRWVGEGHTVDDGHQSWFSWFRRGLQLKRFIGGVWQIKSRIMIGSKSWVLPIYIGKLLNPTANIEEVIFYNRLYLIQQSQLVTK